MRKTIIVEDGISESTIGSIITQSADYLSDIYLNSNKINRIEITVDYTPETNITKDNVVIHNLLKMLPDDPVSSSSIEIVSRSSMVLLCDHYHDKGWMDKDTFYEFAKRFTILYNLDIHKDDLNYTLIDHILDYDEIGNYLTLIGLGYSVPGGYSLRKLHTESAKPYIIDKRE